MLKGKHILVGVTGGIAAYKTASMIRLLVREGAEVKVIMTPQAKDFITPLTLATLSRNPVFSDFFNPGNGDWNSHVDLGIWADLFLIAPATANSMGKMANGIADNLLLTTYFSARCPVFIAPSMDLDMLKHPATVINMETLRAFGNTLIEPETGELASGLTGKGRMAEPEEMLKEIKSFFSKKKRGEPLKGKRILVNAGPTREPVDPVRFISNHSSGKMGLALAEAASDYGAQVDLVLGPVNIRPARENINVIEVSTAASMAAECIERFPACDIAILSAAVADFTPEKSSPVKIKKSEGVMNIRLVPTTDIALELGRMKQKNQLIAGFALENDDEINNAKKKLINKNLDIIVLNSLNEKGAGFGFDTNRISILDKNNNIDNFELKSKDEVARDILDKLVELSHL